MEVVQETKSRYETIQRFLNCCIDYEYKVIDNALLYKYKRLNNKYSIVGLIDDELDLFLNKLNGLYITNPILESLKNYYNVEDFLWESLILENMTKEERFKYATCSSIYFELSKYERDRKYYDDAIPFFSSIIMIVALERYINYIETLKRTREEALNKKWEKYAYKMKDQNNNVGNIEVNDEDLSNNHWDINPFNFQCDKILLKELVVFFNSKKIFKNDITLQDVSMFFSCKKNEKFKLRNGMTKSFVYILYCLANNFRITPEWQNLINKYELVLGAKKTDYLNSNDLSVALNTAKEKSDDKALVEVKNFVNLYFPKL